MKIRKHFTFFLFCQIGMFTYAQEFQFNLYFEDAIGNRDTLVMGYDAEATNGIDSAFGEKDIFNENWDDTFEVRIFNNIYSDLFDSVISATKRQFNPKECTISNYPDISSIGVKCMNYPLKLSWNRELFNNDCIKNSLVTDWNPGGWFDAVHGGEQGPFLFAEVDSCLFLHTTHNYISKEHGNLDLLYITLANSQQIFTSINDLNPIDPIVSIYPNPANTKITIIQPRKDFFTVRIYDLLGNIILQKENHIEIDLNGILSGTYIIQYMSKDVSLSKRLVILR